jgi:hypothetical protein
MKAEKQLLPQVRIASPCPASWDGMEGDDRSRFCGQCRLHVYNLSDMKTAEAEAFLAEVTGRTCVRYYQRSDGTVMTKDCPIGLAAVRRRFAFLVTTVAAFVLMSGAAIANSIRGRDDSEPTPFSSFKNQVRDVQPFKAVIDYLEPPHVAGGI